MESSRLLPTEKKKKSANAHVPRRQTTDVARIPFHAPYRQTTWRATPCSGGDGKAWRSTIGDGEGGTVATTDHSVNGVTDIDEKHQAEATHGDTEVG